jgi:hypothetical protein
LLECLVGREGILSTVGRDEKEDRKSICDQEKQDDRLGHLRLEFEENSPSRDV